MSISDTQRAYLRLVADGMTSKQIAQRLGGSHHTVNVEIGIAMRVLGVKSRHEAAAVLKNPEISHSYDGSYEPPAIATSDPDTAVVPDDGGGDTVVGKRDWPLPIATPSRPINTLKLWQRISWVLAIAAMVALLLGGLVSGVATLLTGLNRLT